AACVAGWALAGDERLAMRLHAADGPSSADASRAGRDPAGTAAADSGRWRGVSAAPADLRGATPAAAAPDRVAPARHPERAPGGGRRCIRRAPRAEPGGRSEPVRVRGDRGAADMAQVAAPASGRFPSDGGGWDR